MDLSSSEKNGQQETVGGAGRAPALLDGGLSGAAPLSSTPSDNMGVKYPLENNDRGYSVSRFSKTYFDVKTETVKNRIFYSDCLPDLSKNPQAGMVDWLNVVIRPFCNLDDLAVDRIRNSDCVFVKWIDPILREYLGYGIKEERPFGKYHYNASWLLEDGISLVMAGGEYQRDTAMLSFSGRALQFLDKNTLRVLCEERIEGWITRIDVCADFFEGEYTVDKAISDHAEGLFNGGGRPPDATLIGPLKVGSAGRTLYVGKRVNNKFCRVYEKGLKEGFSVGQYSKWVRVEVEFKGSRKDRVISWDILASPGQFIAGAYKAFAFISESQDSIKSTVVRTAGNLYRSVGHLQKNYGRVVNALKNSGYSDYQIVDMIKRPDFPSYYQEKIHEVSLDTEVSNDVLAMLREVFDSEAEWL